MLEKTPNLLKRQQKEAVKQAQMEKRTIKPGSLVQVGSSEWTHPDMPYQIRRFLFEAPDKDSGVTKWWVGPVSMPPKKAEDAAGVYAEGGAFSSLYKDCYAVDMTHVTKLSDA